MGNGRHTRTRLAERCDTSSHTTVGGVGGGVGGEGRLACCLSAGSGRRQPDRLIHQGNDAVAAHRATFHRTGTGQPHRLGPGLRLWTAGHQCDSRSTNQHRGQYAARRDLDGAIHLQTVVNGMSSCRPAALSTCSGTPYDGRPGSQGQRPPSSANFLAFSAFIER